MSRRVTKPPYATSTIDVASHRRLKEALYASPGAFQDVSKHSKLSADGGVMDGRGVRDGRVTSDGGVLRDGGVARGGWVGHEKAQTGHKKPPFARTSSFRQASMSDLHRRPPKHPLSPRMKLQHRSSRSVCDDDVASNSFISDEEEDDDDGGSIDSFSSADSSRTLSVGSPNHTTIISHEVLSPFDKRGEERRDGGKGGRGKGAKEVSIEETIKLTLRKMQRPSSQHVLLSSVPLHSSIFSYFF